MILSGGKRIAVALSGGKDSSLVAALLREAGYEIRGYHLRLLDEGFSSIPWSRQKEALESLSKRLGIPLKILDFRREFKRLILDEFIHQYRQGRTPNPCVICNREFKVGRLLAQACSEGCELVATGHYARVENGQLKKNKSLQRDESYVLSLLEPAQISRLCLPLGELTDEEVARSLKDNLSGFKPMGVSQEACFLALGGLKTFINRYLPECMKPGEIVTQSGEVLGEHPGICYFTVGQRKGLSSASSRGGPYYVVRIDAVHNRVIVGSRADLSSRGMLVSKINWLGTSWPLEPVQVSVKIRYNHPGVGARLEPWADKKARIIFDSPQEAVAPGQLAVFYQDDTVLGAGWIEEGITAG